MAHHSPPELLAHVLVHLREVELVLEELMRKLRPQSRFAGTEGLADVSAVLPRVADQIRVHFARDWPRETPIHKNGPKDAHAYKVKASLGHSSINKSYKGAVG